MCGGSSLEFIKAYNPVGLALAAGSSKLSFAMITMTVCVGIVYVLFLFSSVGEDKPTRLGLRALYITSVMLAVWYAEYGLCHLLVKIDGGFHFWTIVIAIVLNFIIGCVLIYFSLEKLFKNYIKDPNFIDDNEKAVYLRWRRARAWMILSAAIAACGMALTVGEVGDSFWDVAVPIIMLLEGLIMLVVNGIRTVSASRVRRERWEMRKLVADGNGACAIIAFVVMVASFAIVGSATDESVANFGVAVLLSAFIVAVFGCIASVTAKRKSKK